MCAEELIKLNAIEVCARLLRPAAEYDATLEATLSTLTVLTAAEAVADKAVAAYALEQCNLGELRLRAQLAAIVGAGGGREECRESVEFAECLQRRLFVGGGGGEEAEAASMAVDR